MKEKIIQLETSSVEHFARLNQQQEIITNHEAMLKSVGETIAKHDALFQTLASSQATAATSHGKLETRTHAAFIKAEEQYNGLRDKTSLTFE